MALHASLFSNGFEHFRNETFRRFEVSSKNPSRLSSHSKQRYIYISRRGNYSKMSVISSETTVSKELAKDLEAALHRRFPLFQEQPLADTLLDHPITAEYTEVTGLGLHARDDMLQYNIFGVALFDRNQIRDPSLVHILPLAGKMEDADANSSYQSTSKL